MILEKEFMDDEPSEVLEEKLMDEEISTETIENEE